jgi:colanic acid/amylovoran biosynthesis glycosyltransferase
MRLAYLISQYPAVNHTFILREIRALRVLGIEVHVISIRASDRTPDKLSEEERDELRQTFTVLTAGLGPMLGAHVMTLSRRPTAYLAGLWETLRLARGDLRRLFANLAYFIEAVVVGDQMRRMNLTHMHCHFSSTVALLVQRVFALTFSATIHGPSEFDDVIGFHMAEKVARATFLCAISSYGRSQLMKASDPQHWDKLEISPLGVECDQFPAREPQPKSDCFQVLCVGRLAPAKAQEVLVAAIDRLVRQGRSVHLRLVGDGPNRSRLESRIATRSLQRHVSLEGSCNYERVLALYQQADLFALASFAEGVPVVLMEAMAMGIPCVATWITGIPELIRHGVDGWLVPPADEEQLANAIARMMDDPELRRNLGRAGRERVKEKYELKQNVARLAAIYRRWLTSSSS